MGCRRRVHGRHIFGPFLTPISLVETQLNAVGKKLSMHVVASKPLYLSGSDVPADAMEEEKAVFLAQMAEEEASKGGKVS